MPHLKPYSWGIFRRSNNLKTAKGKKILLISLTKLIYSDKFFYKEKTDNWGRKKIVSKIGIELIYFHPTQTHL